MSFMMAIQTKLKIDNWSYDQLFTFLDKAIIDSADKTPDLKETTNSQEYLEEQDKSFFYS